MSIFLIYAIFIVLYLWLVWKAGRTYPIIYLFVFTYFIQYIFSTYLIYNEYKILSYQMPIEQGQYFQYTIGALSFLFAGVFLFNKDVDIREALTRIDPRQSNNLGYLLLAVSYGLDFFQLIGITSLSSIISFTSYLKYVAAFCFLFSKSKFNYFLIAVIYLQLGASVLSGGVFISFFIWSTFLFFFICLKYKFPFLLRAAFIIIAVPVLIVVQSVKDKYRAETWEGQREGGLNLFTELAAEETKKNDGEPFSESKGVISTVARLSQGWHLGLTLRRVPKKEPYAEGNEMISDIAASIIPRIFFPEKKSVNSQDKFYQYTGHKLRGSTAMSIGVLGDFYVNYGIWGSYAMLFLFGVLIIKLFNWFMRRYVFPDPINIIWIPFILSYLIRGNNDFYIFFNGMIKGFLIFLAINYIRYRFMGAKKPGPGVS
jgi:hypothetical protein